MAAFRFGLCGALVVGAAGCPRGGGTTVSRPPPAPGWGLGAEVLGELGVHGLATAGDDLVVSDQARVRRLARDGAVRWSVELGPSGLLGVAANQLAVDGDTVAVALNGVGDVVPGLPRGLRGEPGAAIAGLSADDGKTRWLVGAGSSRWTVVSAVVSAGDGFLVSGSFGGTLRVGEQTVTAAGNGDGFVASLDRAGVVRWLRRVGGDGPDDITGVAALGGGRVAIAGTFTGPAELGETTLEALSEPVIAADGFVAVLEPTGAVAWSRTWGSTREDTCAGLAVLDGGAIAVAGTVRGEVDVAGRRLEVQGPGDGLVAVFAADATVQGAWLVGGVDFDGITAIGGAGDRVVVAGWFIGTLPGPVGTSVQADGVDDLFVAVGDASGPSELHAVTSMGPASVTALAVGRDGWRLAVFGKDPLTSDGDARPRGAAIWFRGL